MYPASYPLLIHKGFTTNVGKLPFGSFCLWFNIMDDPEDICVCIYQRPLGYTFGKSLG